MVLPFTVCTPNIGLVISNFCEYVTSMISCTYLASSSIYATNWTTPMVGT